MQKIIIFGYSGMGRFVQYSLDTKQYQVVAFLDNCEKIWNGENKIPILSPEKVKELEYEIGRASCRERVLIKLYIKVNFLHV